MKTSQKEGVSDRPTTPHDLPRYEASQHSGGRLVPVERKWTPYKPVRILALLPLRSPTRDAAPYIVAVVVAVETGVTNGF